jgi:hypothetical protein
MLNMDFASFLALLVISLIAGLVMHYAIHYRVLDESRRVPLQVGRRLGWSLAGHTRPGTLVPGRQHFPRLHHPRVSGRLHRCFPRHCGMESRGEGRGPSNGLNAGSIVLTAVRL